MHFDLCEDRLLSRSIERILYKSVLQIGRASSEEPGQLSMDGAVAELRES